MSHKAFVDCFPVFAGILISYLLYVIIRGGTPWIVRRRREKYFEAPDGFYLLPSILDKATLDLSVIVPAYNEEIRLPKMLDETVYYLEHLQRFATYDYRYEVIIVDDGSRDGTSKVALKYSLKYGTEKIRIIRLIKNRGKGGAVRMGMLSARGKVLLMADADGSTKFSDFEEMLKKLNEINTHEHGMAIAVGSRAHMDIGAIASRSLITTALMKTFDVLVWFFCVRSVRDSQCGFKLFTRPAALSTFLNLHVERWAFDVELLYIAEQLRIPTVEVSVRWHDVEGSKLIPIFSSLAMGIDILMMWLHYQLYIWRIKKYVD